MKRISFIFSIFLMGYFAPAQSHHVDSLRWLVKNAKEDATKVLAIYALAEYYGFNQFDSSIFYAKQTIDLSKKLDYPRGSFLGLQSLFFAYNCQGNYAKALEVTLENAKIAEKIKNEVPFAVPSISYFLGVLNREMGNYSTAISHLRQTEQMAKATGQEADLSPTYSHLALTYLNIKQFDSALWCAQKSYDLSLHPNRWSRFKCFASTVLGSVLTARGNFELAMEYFRIGVQQSKMVNNAFFLARNYYNLANLFGKTGFTDSCIYYARISLELCREHNFGEFAMNASTLLTNVYDSQDKPDSMIKYMRIMLSTQDSVFGQKKVKAFQKAVFDEELQRQELKNKQEQYKQRTRGYVLFAAMVAVLLIALIILRNISLKRKNESHRREIAENELQLEKLESERTKAELEQQATELEMQALRAQMNPHFIFNCLSSINRFILKNESETASDYLTKFSRLIRMVLNNSQNPLITLEDELEMLRLYLDLEKLRFKDSFEYAIRYNELDLSSIYIPPLLLQPFAENAIWHGLMNKEGKGLLDISLESDNEILNCYITDNGIGRKQAEAFKSKSAEKQKSMGMRITADRLALLNNDDEQTIFYIEDLVDTEGRAAGTKVTLKIRFKGTLEELH